MRARRGTLMVHLEMSSGGTRYGTSSLGSQTNKPWSTTVLPIDCAGGHSLRTYTCSSGGITLLSWKARDVFPCCAPPPVANPTGVELGRTHLCITLLRACRPMRCLPAAVSHNQVTLLSVMAGTAGISGATAAGAEGCPLALEIDLGGGPVYFLLGSWENAHCLA